MSICLSPMLAYLYSASIPRLLLKLFCSMEVKYGGKSYVRKTNSSKYWDGKSGN